MEKEYEHDLERERAGNNTAFTKNELKRCKKCVFNIIFTTKVYQNTNLSVCCQQKQTMILHQVACLVIVEVYNPYQKTLQLLKSFRSLFSNLSLNTMVLPYKGTKDQLVLCVFLLRHCRHHLAFKSQIDEIKLTIKQAKRIVYAEIEHNIVNTNVDVRRKRNYGTAEHVKDKSMLTIPDEMQSISEIPTKIFCDLIHYMEPHWFSGLSDTKHKCMARLFKSDKARTASVLNGLKKQPI